MHTLIVKKSTKLIVNSRFDNSTGGVAPMEDVFKTYCSDNNLDMSLYEIVEIPHTNFGFVIGKHTYINNEIGVSPDWIDPPIVETSAIPVSDPGAPA